MVSALPPNHEIMWSKIQRNGFGQSDGVEYDMGSFSYLFK